jgi:hypothetical protein
VKGDADGLERMHVLAAALHANPKIIAARISKSFELQLPEMRGESMEHYALTMQVQYY